MNKLTLRRKIIQAMVPGKLFFGEWQKDAGGVQIIVCEIILRVQWNILGTKCNRDFTNIGLLTFCRQTSIL